MCEVLETEVLTGKETEKEVKLAGQAVAPSFKSDTITESWAIRYGVKL